MPRPSEALIDMIENEAIAIDVATGDTGLPEVLDISNAIATTRLANAMERQATALERIAAAEEARETRESGSTFPPA